MGHKTHPIGFRLGVSKDWHSRWFAPSGKEYRQFVWEDLQIRSSILEQYPDASISKIDIERNSSDLIATIYTARPGIVIGRGGQRVEELRKMLEELTSKKARLNVQEIRQPELDAYLVARGVADQLERRIAFRRAIRQAVSRTMQSGAKGVRVMVSGRLGGADIARTEKAREGRVPLHTLKADVDFAIAEAATDFGRIGVKVWIYHGDAVGEAEIAAELEEMGTIEVTLSPDEPAVEVEEAPVAEVKEEPAAEVEEAPVAEVKEEPAVEVEEAPVAEVKEEPAAEVEEAPVVVPKAKTKRATATKAKKPKAATKAKAAKKPAKKPAKKTKITSKAKEDDGASTKKS
ncbi:MAG: 30S ribosomal protein S3 [Chloroflexi bacterium]|nr:30S ribosomal protein S3 [Chloroflexota bacterium]